LHGTLVASTSGSPISLAPFAHDRIGGNIHSVAALADQLASYTPAITEVTTALDRQAGQLAEGGGVNVHHIVDGDALVAAALAVTAGQARSPGAGGSAGRDRERAGN
jgi:hypothetical protein